MSNGFHKFHLAFAAEQLAANDQLSCLMTGIYPTITVKAILSRLGLDRRASAQRLIDRGVDVPAGLVRSYWSGEFAEHAGRLAHSRGLAGWGERLACLAMKRYAARAEADLRTYAPKSAIYHYRAGFGGPSVKVAQNLGLKTLCDHSAVHPLLFRQLIEAKGKLDGLEGTTISPFWQAVYDDIQAADHVLVNSEFVQQTFEMVGAKTGNVHVVYLGIDNEFARILSTDDIADLKRAVGARVPKILFAGGFQIGKGALEVIEGLKAVWSQQWQFEIAGTVDSELLHNDPDFFFTPKVKQHGWLRREELARVMADADIFLFPSRAEGSARVVFEALASGCFVITTPNAGSIVKHGVNGLIVPAGDEAAVGRAVTEALANIDAARRIGLNNAGLVRSQFTQADYGRSLGRLHERIVSQ